MIAPVERSPERDAALAAMLAHVPELGWTRRALGAGLAAIGASPEDADLLFPGGAAALIEAYADLADRWMEAAAAARDLAGLRVSERVRALIALRLEQNRPYKEAVRRAVARMALPRYGGVAARSAARTVDAIWHAAGDVAADFSWYTKRGTLAAVYAATVLFWLRDDSEDDAATLEFLDRRLAGVAAVAGLRRRAGACAGRLLPASAAPGAPAT
jgi:ubiquinone biosynthesis protein COQ9